MFHDGLANAKDADFVGCPPEVEVGQLEVCEQFMKICLQEQRKLQDMMQIFQATYSADMDRCHRELHVILGKVSCQQATFQGGHSDVDSINQLLFDSRSTGRYSSAGSDTLEFSESLGADSANSPVNHRTSDEVSKDRRKRNININYHELETRNNKLFSKRLHKNISASRQFMYEFFTKRFLKLDSLRSFVTGAPFHDSVAVLIVLNAIVIGFATNYELEEAFDTNFGRNPARSARAADIFGVINSVFTVMFCIELSLRMAALEFRFFFASDWKWNLLDLVLVMISVIETVLTNSSLQLSYIRVLRLFRVFRTLRVVREVPFFEKLRTMINAVANSVSSLLWALVLLFFTIYMFSCVFLQGTTQYILNSSDGHDTHIEFLVLFFPNMHRTMLTLFMTITSGIGWWDVEEMLLDVGWVYGALFVLYIAVMILALLNIVTGIFLNDALEMAEMDRELQKNFELEKKAQVADELRAIFSSLDSDDSGKVSFDEFEGFMGSADVSALFAVYGLDVADTVSFFDALDVDEDRQLGVEEFVVGCIQLRGQAKTVDLVTHMRENKKIMQRITASAKNTEAQLKDLRHIVAVACEGLANAAHSFDCSVAQREIDEVPDLCMHPSRRVHLL